MTDGRATNSVRYNRLVFWICAALAIFLFAVSGVDRAQSEALQRIGVQTEAEILRLERDLRPRTTPSGQVVADRVPTATYRLDLEDGQGVWVYTADARDAFWDSTRPVAVVPAWVDATDPARNTVDPGHAAQGSFAFDLIGVIFAAIAVIKAFQLWMHRRDRRRAGG